MSAKSKKTETQYLKKGKLAFSKKNYSEAIKCFKKAIDLGDILAMNELGFMYLAGIGVERNYIEAAKLLKKAADGGNAPAMFNIATMYHHGYGVDVNLEDAVFWYRKSAELGDEFAMCELGAIYCEGGEGVNQNIEKGEKWYVKASESDNPEVLYYVACFYIKVKRDVKSCVKYLEKSADMGFETAINALEGMKQQGLI